MKVYRILGKGIKGVNADDVRNLMNTRILRERLKEYYNKEIFNWQKEIIEPYWEEVTKSYGKDVVDFIREHFSKDGIIDWNCGSVEEIRNFYAEDVDRQCIVDDNGLVLYELLINKLARNGKWIDGVLDDEEIEYI